MLIKALCDYYDILSSAGKVLPEGYSSVKVHYVISLTEDGIVDEIIDCQKTEQYQDKKNNVKERKVPVELMMPQRTEKPGIDANVIEHRPLYIFGLSEEDRILTPTDRTMKAQKSHKAFVETNLRFTEGLDSPVVRAYRGFLTKWVPEQETENPWLLKLGKDYGKSGYAFCLSGSPDQLLHEDPELKAKWEEVYRQENMDGEGEFLSQCAIMGGQAPVARIHNKIRGVYGGLATGSVLIGFNNESENSYGNEQSYNSNISEAAMKKYTEALNYLLAGDKHKMMLDDTTIIFWAMNPKETQEELFFKMLFGSSDSMGAEQTERMLKELLSDAKQANITRNRLQSSDLIDADTDFYIAGLKPNSSRLSVKFIMHRKYGEILWNIAEFQQDLQMTQELHPVSLFRIKKELISPKSKNDTVNPALMANILESILYRAPYPVSLLETMVRRVKTDSGNEKINPVRAGVIKAWINRNYPKEALNVGLDTTNHEQAYLCGRLFAVLEKLQQDASNYSLNRTIKDAYFSSACAKPALVFPKLIRLAQNHLNKVKAPVYYNKLIGEIIGQLNGEFPETFLLKDQGKFIIGYYQQNQSFYEPSEKKKETEEE